MFKVEINDNIYQMEENQKIALLNATRDIHEGLNMIYAIEKDDIVIMTKDQFLTPKKLLKQAQLYQEDGFKPYYILRE